MSDMGLETGVVDAAVRQRTIARFAREGWRLPTFAELAEPETIDAGVRDALRGVDPDAADARNLFRVHWHNAADRRGLVDVPGHLVLGEELTGVKAPIVLLYGDRFPMITAHKVLAAYACLVPRLISGRFDPERHRAIWPSTGNYCRGGVAISRTLGCRGVAVLPAGMSEERFEWLGRWVDDPNDVIRTPGSESNVKEIYDACTELARDEQNLVFNQFCEFANHLVHWRVTGPAFSRVYQALKANHPKLKLEAFVSATGSAGTIGAGDFLKDEHGAQIVAVEALECPTMLYNGYGEHNIQGIGDKHIPLIHNVTNTDVVAAVSDRSTDSLNLLFNTDVGRAWLREERGLTAELVDSLRHLGLSSICNLLAAIQYAKRKELGRDQLVMTVATDGADLYRTEEGKALTRLFPGGFGRGTAEVVFNEHLAGTHDGHLLECGMRDRDRIFNLGYFTWVEQQGVSLEDFERRRHQEFWRELRGHVEQWDAGVVEFNREAGTV